MTHSTFAFLDIETSHSPLRIDGTRGDRLIRRRSWPQAITVIGIYRNGLGTVQLQAPAISSEKLLAALEGVERLFTYNGSAFDLRIIHEQLGVNLAKLFLHRDLMFDCWKRKLKGGLKGVERTLGIHRDTEGVDGYQAVKLWNAWQDGNAEALELLLRYNREDCQNLEVLARRIGVLPVEEALRA